MVLNPNFTINKIRKISRKDRSSMEVILSKLAIPSLMKGQ